MKLEYFIDFFESNPFTVKLIWSFIVIFIFVSISRAFKSLFYSKINDSKKYYPIKQKINYISGIIIIIFLVFIWLNSVNNLTTYIGLLSAGIAIALKELFTNIAGWAFIESRKPFDVGHRIKIGDQKGDVIDIRLFQFTLMEVTSFEDGEQSSGRIVDVPNGYIFTYPTINYTKGFEYIWNEIKVLLTYESNWKKAKDELLAIAYSKTEITTSEVADQIQEASKRYMIHYQKLTPIVYIDCKESGVQLTIRYLCKPKMRRNTSNDIWEEILNYIEKNDDINLAYPTKRVINL